MPAGDLLCHSCPHLSLQVPLPPPFLPGYRSPGRKMRCLPSACFLQVSLSGRRKAGGRKEGMKEVGVGFPCTSAGCSLYSAYPNHIMASTFSGSVLPQDSSSFIVITSSAPKSVALELGKQRGVGKGEIMANTRAFEHHGAIYSHSAFTTSCRAQEVSWYVTPI